MLEKLYTLSDAQIVELMERIRFEEYGGIIVCPECYSKTVDTDKRKGVSYRYRCRNPQCQAVFTLKTGTLMRNSKLPLRGWLTAFMLMSITGRINGYQLVKHGACGSYTTAYRIAPELNEKCDADLWPFSTNWFRELERGEPVAKLRHRDPGPVEFFRYADVDPNFVSLSMKDYFQMLEHENAKPVDQRNEQAIERIKDGMDKLRRLNEG